jgi:predicted secreted protein
MADLAVIPKESAKAAQAFADYVNLGPSRSLAKLARGKSARYLRQLEYWSSDYQWQERLKQLAVEQVEQAQEARTSTYVLIAGEYHRRVSDEPMRKSMQLSALHGIFDRVKPETVSDSGGGSSAHLTIQFVFQEVVRP